MTVLTAYLVVAGLAAVGLGLTRGLQAAVDGRGASLPVALLGVGLLCLMYAWSITPGGFSFQSATEAVITIWVDWTR